MELLTLIVIVVLVFMLINHGKRLSKIERSLFTSKKLVENKSDAQQGDTDVVHANQAITHRSDNELNIHLKTVSKEPALSNKEKESSDFINWFKEDLLLKIGAGLLILALVWFVSYAIAQGWIGEVGRITIGLLLGATFIAVGYWRIRSHPKQGGVFLVLGSISTIITIVAARELYGMFTSISGFAIMFFSILLVSIASIVYKRYALALSSIVLASLVPVLLNVTLDYIALYIYLLVIVLGTIWTIIFTKFRSLILVSFIIYVLYSLQYVTFSQTGISDGILFFAFLFSAIFFVFNTYFIIKNKDSKPVSDILTAVFNAMFLLAWIGTYVRPEWQSLVTIAWSIVFIVGSYSLYVLIQRKEPFYIYSGVSIILLGVATAFELSGPALVIAFALEALVVTFVTYLLSKNVNVTEKVSFVFVVPILMSINSMSLRYWGGDIFNRHFLILFGLGIFLLGVGYFLYMGKKALGKEKDAVIGLLWTILGSFYIGLTYWLSLHVSLPTDTAITIAMVTYTIVALICYILGKINDKKGLVTYGGVLLGLVIVRLLLIDVWSMQTTERIITFFLIGILLVGTAFIKGKKTEINNEQNQI